LKEKEEKDEMSAYGAIPRPSALDTLLASTIWECTPTRLHEATAPSWLTIHHLTLAAAKALPGLIEHLNSVFALEIEAGITYPQETMEGDGAFEAYFFAGDVFVGIVGGGPPGTAASAAAKGVKVMSIEESQNGRSWKDCVAGFYYIKPNYPGRSSHICNGGFIVSPNYRGCGFGIILGKSYLHYAPKLGYRASVFNLVFVNNTASVRLWQHLGFEKIGLIPKAGRLKRTDGPGEEYVDAWIIYKSFVEE